MIPKKYNYIDIDGNHWPDANQGDDLYYAFDFTCYLLTEQETIDSVEWLIPEGITSSDDYIVDGKEAHVKLATHIPGVFTITGKVNTLDAGKSQTNNIVMKLKVF